MSTLKIYDGAGECIGDMPLAVGDLEAQKGTQAVHDVVVAYLANQRAGTASTLAKGRVAGSNRKPWRQKGTGRARAGFRQSPVWRGGGVAFGPHPRSFRQKLPRNVARLAFRRAWRDRADDGAARVVEAPVLATPKTREMAAWLAAQKVSGPALLICDRIGESLRLASRNIPGLELVTAAHVNTYQVLRYAAVLVLRDAMPILNQRLGAEEQAS